MSLNIGDLKAVRSHWSVVSCSNSDPSSRVRCCTLNYYYSSSIFTVLIEPSSLKLLFLPL